MKLLTLTALLFFQGVIYSFAQLIDKQLIHVPATLKHNTYALIIGISKYPPGSKQLYFADSDAKAFHDFLLSDEGGSVPENHIKMFLNDNATMENIMEIGVKWLVDNAKSGDWVFIYFSGHGITYNSGESYLLTYDLKIPFDKYNLSFHGGLQMHLVKDYINDMTQNKKVKVFLIIDACRSSDDEDKREDDEQIQPSAMNLDMKDYMFFATTNGQISEEDNPFDKKWDGHGVFTYYLLKGLKGSADGVGGTKPDGIITIGKLRNYLYTNIANATSNQQQPFFSDNMPLDMQLSKLDTIKTIALKQNAQQLTNYFASVPPTSKGVISSGKDSTANLLYAHFIQSLSKDSLLGNSSADYYFTKLENCSGSVSLKQEALYLFCAALETDGEKIIDIYLGSHLNQLINDKIKNEKNIEEVFNNGEEKMSRLYELREKYYQDKKYNNVIEAKMLFLKARTYALSTESFQLGEAGKSIKQAITINNTHPYFHHILALIYYSEKKYPLAIIEERKTLKLYPNWSYAYNNLGAAYGGLNKFDSAKKYFLKSIQNDSTSESVVDAYNNLGALYLHIQYPKAIEYYIKSIQMDSTYAPSYRGLGIVYNNLKEYDTAKKYFIKATQLDSNSEDADYRLGCVYYELKEYPEAIKLYKMALVINPKDSLAYYNMACAYSLIGDKQNALVNIELSIQNGYRIYNQIFNTDSDFDNIRNSPEFQALKKKYFPDKEK